MSNYIKEVKAVSIFSIIGLIIFGFIFLIGYFDFENYLYQSFLYYLGICLVFLILKTFIKAKIFIKIADIILLPAGIIFTLGAVLLPFWTLFIHLLYYFILTVLIPYFTIDFLYKESLIPIKNESTIFYLQFTISVVLAVIFSHQIRTIIYYISPARTKTSKKLKPNKLKELTDYFLSEENIRFVIYSLYIFLLLIINIKSFEDSSYSKSFEHDKAILASFVTFIAIERAITYLEKVKFKPSDLLNKMFDSVLNKFEDLEEKSSNNVPEQQSE